MQKDAAAINLGTVVNRGFTMRQDVHNSTTDDLFAVSVEVLMSDSAGTATDTKYEVHFAASFGDNLVVTSDYRR